MKPTPLLGSLALGLAAMAVQAAEYPAELAWAGRVSLAMPVTGVVETVTAQAGQWLKKGELMATLDPVQFKAGVAEAKADVDRLAVEQADAQRDLDRVKELYARTVSATTELDAAQLRFDRATAALAGAQARLEKARHQLAQSELRAPFDAIVLERLAEPGMVAATPCQPTPLFTVARANEMVAQAVLRADQARHVVPAGKAEVLVGGMTFKGEIRGVSLRPDGKYRLEVALPMVKDLAPGQPATIRLP